MMYGQLHVSEGNIRSFFSALLFAASIVVFGEAHLHRIPGAYTSYYNVVRPHLSLSKDSPCHRPIQRLGQVVARPILGGLHHEYCRT